MATVKKGIKNKNTYEMKTPKIGQRELKDSKKALQLLRTERIADKKRFWT
jgi:hypothetical protein